MPNSNDPGSGYGTLIISALLILTIGFAGYWIMLYASGTGRPWDLVRWFSGAAAIIVVVGIWLYVRRR